MSHSSTAFIISADLLVIRLEKDDGQPSSPRSSPTKSSAKRTQSEIKQELDEEEDEEDNEPVKKRPNRGEARKLPQESTKRQAELHPTDAPESKKRGAKTAGRKKNLPSTTNGSRAKQTETRTRGKIGGVLPVLSKDKNTAEQKIPKASKANQTTKNETKEDEEVKDDDELNEDEEDDSDEDEEPEVAAKAREKVQSTLKSKDKDPYPDWKPGESAPYAALCTTFSLIEMTSKRLIISAHCSLFLRQVLRLTPNDLLPTVQLMINKLAADYAGIELGIGESLIMKAIGESTGRSLAVIKADQAEIGDLGLVAAKSRGNQPTMFKPKALTIKGVLHGLMGIATVKGDGSQGRKVDGIKKLLSAADSSMAGKGNKGIDITKDKGGASEAKFIIRFLEGKLRLGLAEKTVLVALAHAMVSYEIEKSGNKTPSSEQLAKGEAILKTVYRYAN